MEQEFDDLEPEESKRRLGMLVKKMDKDGDSNVSREELVDWILMSFKYVGQVTVINCKYSGNNLKQFC